MTGMAGTIDAITVAVIMVFSGVFLLAAWRIIELGGRVAKKEAWIEPDSIAICLVLLIVIIWSVYRIATW